MNKSALLLGLISVMILNSCTSVLDFQTAKTLGVGNNELIVSATAANSISDEEYSTPWLSPSIEFKRGFHERLDIGIQTQLFNSATLNLKYQFVGDIDTKLAFAVTHKLGYGYTISDDLTLRDAEGYYTVINSFDFLDDDFDFETDDIFDQSIKYGMLHEELGLVGSYHFSKELAVTSALKGIVLYNSDASSYTLANTYGVEIGKKIKLSMNFGYNFAWVQGTGQDGFAIGRFQYGFGVKKPITFGGNKEEKKTLN
ncbi:MAG: hypothetical protein ACI8XB_001260 [Patiriisocius sp.]|jgi:hypothetical protein